MAEITSSLTNLLHAGVFMYAPMIAITRHQEYLYEWQTVFGANVFENEVGDTSITGCLQSGIESISDNALLVEVSYEGIHMGTFHVARIREFPAAVATEINSKYGTLVGGIE
jgi:hypothetical protein